MPLYEYRCDECGETTEILQKFSDKPATQCPFCSKPGLKKQISAAGFQLKGTGWYVTDFRDGKKPSKPTEDKSADKQPAEKSSADKTTEKPKAESKPVDKSDN